MTTPEAGEKRTPAPSGEPLLRLKDVTAGYGPVQVLHGISLDVTEGEIVCLLGSNAAGKSTTLKSILGLVRPSGGEVHLRGERVDGLPAQKIVARGITMVPEGRRLFSKMSVRENLNIGAQLRKDDEKIGQDLQRVLKLFPRLEERLEQKAGTLSGGEQQMCAIGRALMADPKILLMDEPSMGLAPILVEQVFETIEEINKLGTTIFLVEQNANMALSIADRGYVIQTGRVVLADTAKKLLENPQTREAYLGELT
ncbi:MAG TPA: ABC transporter ATP-binding protein [Actinomycetota bacterium]